MIRRAIALTVIALLAACTSPALLPKPKQAVPVGSYPQDPRKGAVVLSVNWGRALKCGSYRYAQLRGFGFDRIPLQAVVDGDVPDVFIEGSPYFKESEPVNYLLAIEPGIYALTHYAIEVAASTFNVKIGTVGPSALMKNGAVIGGTFDVKQGELVYIGHFGLSCNGEPSFWRDYPDDPGTFDQYKAVIKRRYDLLDVESMQFRPFKTTLFGKQ
ncbi:conserved exported protein of unknown function [Nitrospira japonica]|uniref:Lipoprotein n=1 Tax=Nitrospira japonica TaxID=1325564 RepID=A0A1W1IA81_9BACT|nr:hypothetical protein [Nitrospira japonica]SLM49673.1 conserved exported protein of unknown function [Nitrospira japonica]